MALFGKKSQDTPASGGNGSTAAPTGTAPGGEKKKGFALGRKKGEAASAPAAVEPAPTGAGGGDDFFDFSEDALAAAGSAGTNGSAAHAEGEKGKKKTAKPKGLKSGTVVGLNIGTDSIKAIELRVKGTEIAITGMGMLPTPEDSIANGVVMSVATLAHAIRDVMQQAGIKSKRVVTSVAGTGALVVRVIEVPKMSDNELEDNMKVDADRYIPFPPSEVIMDFKALRDLPTDPDAPNMEVLLAAAQREIIDLHVQVIEGAKLDPRSIDVEPLSAVRALTAREINPDAPGSDTIDGSDYVDYGDVSAVINIGASSTEISIVRGDVLVFTRNVPTGGQTLTQAIVDHFGLHWPDAEHAKRQWGDALPQPVAAAQTAQVANAGTDFFGATDTGEATDDWSEFGLDDTTFDTDTTAAPPSGGSPSAISAAAASAAAATAPDTFSDPFAVATPGAAPATPAATASADPFDLDFNNGNQDTSTTTPAASDPFDLDFFSQGPQDTPQKEPGEQHGQKEEDDPNAPKNPPVFDFSSFNLDDDEPAEAAGSEEKKLPTLAELSALPGDLDDDDTLLPTTSSTPGQTTVVPSAFDFPTTPSGLAAFGLTDDDDDAALPTVVGAPGATSAPGSGAPINLTDDDEAALPTVTDATPASTAGAGAAAGATGAAATGAAAGISSFSFGETPPAPHVAASIIPEPAGAEEEVPNFDFDLTPTVATEAATPAPAPVTVPAEDDDFDIDSLFGESSTTGTPDVAATGDFGVADAGLGHEAGGLAPVGAAAAADFGGFDDALESFGAGLTDTGLSMGIDAQALFSVLNPILEGLTAEVRRSLEYHATRYPDAAVQHITLVGGGAMLKNMDAYFTQSLGIPTTVGNPLAGLKVQAPKLPPDYATQMGPLFVVALGLALRDLVR